MDVDISDILAEAGRGGPSSSSLPTGYYDVDTAYTDHILLTRAWTSERCTPALLPYPSALVERVMSRVRSQIARIEDLASGISDGTTYPAPAPAPPPSNQNLNLILSILQTDLSRTQFLLRSLLRQRLAKIGKFAQFYVQQLDPRFLRHHQVLLHSYYDATFLAGFPPALRRLDDSSGGVSMVDGPDVDAAVVMHQGDVMIVRWRDVSRAVYDADYDAGCAFPIRYLITATPWKRDIFIEVHQKIDKRTFRRALLDFFLAQHKAEPVCKNEYISVYPRPRARQVSIDHGEDEAEDDKRAKDKKEDANAEGKDHRHAKVEDDQSDENI
ncbi:hypothetical protein DV735_g1073, partial [Chaetothyriales sp. CBS 134920]